LDKDTAGGVDLDAAETNDQNFEVGDIFAEKEASQPSGRANHS
jgi:hypothetical protein